MTPQSPSDGGHLIGKMVRVNAMGGGTFGIQVDLEIGVEPICTDYDGSRYGPEEFHDGAFDRLGKVKQDAHIGQCAVE